MTFNYRTRRFGAVALGLTVVGGMAAGTLMVNPVAAAGIVSAVTTVSCSVTGANWCISGNNSSSGIGVIGTSKSGTGLWGASTSQFGLRATSGSGTAIVAQTTSGSSGITAYAPSGVGVNASGDGGVFGEATSTHGTGVEGSSSSGRGIGIYGSAFKDGIGVFGTSTSSTGVYGMSFTGTAGDFESGGNGITVNAGGQVGVLARNINGHGADVEGANIGLIGRAPTSGYPLALNRSDGDGTGVFNVDGKGDVFYKGTLTHVAATASGAAVHSFSPNSTQPTVEDTGTAQLIGGAAVVRLDPAFAASIEPTAAYRVFITPNGDTRGWLFVASKTTAGFIVREAQAGHSTVTFDYRIVATSLGATGQHMAFLSPAAARALAPSVPRPIVPAVRPPARLPMPDLGPATP